LGDFSIQRQGLTWWMVFPFKHFIDFSFCDLIKNEDTQNKYAIRGNFHKNHKIITPAAIATHLPSFLLGSFSRIFHFPNEFFFPFWFLSIMIRA